MTTEVKALDTRQKIINAAFIEMHRYGYQGMRIDKVLKNTKLKKGALYHHFPSKKSLALVVLEEKIGQKIHHMWVEPLKSSSNPLDLIYLQFKLLGDELWSDEFFTLGCPLNNLAQEMSPIDEGFREQIEIIFQHWQAAISAALKKGQEDGLVDNTVNTDDSAITILASIEGALSLTKTYQNKDVFYSCCRELKRYLDTLKWQR